jgi:hypothetical protein
MDTGIRINLTSKEASAGPQDPVPNGQYLVAVTDCEQTECGEESKNPGKPYYKVEFTVQEGPYEGRKIWTNAMLFSGALYTIVNMLKAVGIDVDKDSGFFQVEGFDDCTVPDPDWWIARQMVVKTKVQKGGYKKGEKAPDGERYDDKSEVKGFYPASSWKGVPTAQAAVSTGAVSLLP